MIMIEHVNLLHTAEDFTDCIFKNQQSRLTLAICPAVDNHITNLNGDAADSLNMSCSRSANVVSDIIRRVIKLMDTRLETVDFRVFRDL